MRGEERATALGQHGTSVPSTENGVSLSGPVYPTMRATLGPKVSRSRPGQRAREEAEGAAHAQSLQCSRKPRGEMWTWGEGPTTPGPLCGAQGTHLSDGHALALLWVTSSQAHTQRQQGTRAPEWVEELSERWTQSQRETQTTALPLAPSSSRSFLMQTTATCTAQHTVPRASSHRPQAPWTPMSKPICCQGPARPASCGHARFGAQGGLSGRRHSPIMASPSRTPSARPCGLTWVAIRLCVCEDPWLRQRRRATPLGELQVPLRKLVPNRARSFNVCLEKRRLTKRPKSLDAARGMSLYEEDEVEMEAAGEDRGRILLSLCYSSQRGGLLVGVLRCAHLAPMDANGYSDPFVRLFLHPNVGKKSKYKTSVWKKTLNPEFNEEFFYAGPREELAQKTLLISVWDYDLGTADDFIGGVQLSSQASGECQQHWHECLGHSNHRLELWHPLDSAPLQLSD